MCVGFGIDRRSLRWLSRGSILQGAKGKRERDKARYVAPNFLRVVPRRN